MCETTIFLEKNGERQRILDDVMRLELTEEGVRLSKLFTAPQTVAARLSEVDFQRHTATLVATTDVAAAPAFVLRRRSVREFTDAPVSDEHVQVLLEAAMAAPSANDVRPWHFIVVRDAEQRRALARTHQWSTMCAHAPVVFAVVGDPTRSDHWVEDCSAATENLLLTAAELRLGGVWVGIYPQPRREAHVHQALDIPDRLQVLCLVPVGHPAFFKPPRTRYERSKVHYDNFGSCS